MSGTVIALETYLIASVISFIVAGLILLIRNILSGGNKNKPEA
jgi:hypothetical protein